MPGIATGEAALARVAAVARDTLQEFASGQMAHQLG